MAPPDFSQDEFHIEDPETGQVLEGTMEEETTGYHELELKAEETSEKLWMIPFADLMTTLVILFLALFGYAYLGSTSDYERAIVQLQKELADKKSLTKIERKEKEAELAKKMEMQLKEEELKKHAHVEVTAQRIRISLATPVLFDSGRADLKTEGARALASIAELLKETPNAVWVEGHTDDRPVRRSRYRSNFELSAARAFSVIEYFIRKGVDPARFSAFGYGEYRPVAKNDTAEGRARNRRIEIDILRENS